MLPIPALRFWQHKSDPNAAIMDVATAASAVAEFKPKYVYPYHYCGRENGTQDPAEFATLVGEAAEVKMGSWYG